jgi:hypothetical protein
LNSIAASSKQKSPWAAAVASLLLAWLQWPLLHMYGLVHWGALFTPGRDAKLPESITASLLDVLHTLETYRILLGLASLAFAIWALLSKPRWVGAVALSASLVGCFFGLVQM